MQNQDLQYIGNVNMKLLLILKKDIHLSSFYSTDYKIHQNAMVSSLLLCIKAQQDVELFDTIYQ